MGKSRRQYPKPADIEAFAGAADMASRPTPQQPAPAPAAAGDRPWRAASIRTDVERNVLAPLPEDYRVALKWLAEQGVIRSQRQLASSALQHEIDRLIAQATGSPVRSSGEPE